MPPCPRALASAQPVQSGSGRQSWGQLPTHMGRQEHSGPRDRQRSARRGRWQAEMPGCHHRTWLAWRGSAHLVIVRVVQVNVPRQRLQCPPVKVAAVRVEAIARHTWQASDGCGGRPHAMNNARRAAAGAAAAQQLARETRQQQAGSPWHRCLPWQRCSSPGMAASAGQPLHAGKQPCKAGAGGRQRDVGKRLCRAVRLCSRPRDSRHTRQRGRWRLKIGSAGKGDVPAKPSTLTFVHFAELVDGGRNHSIQSCTGSRAGQGAAE